ncbi:MAG: crossover junction endodeoxyribonuclease RuvC [Pseudomonadota bacterium]
MTRTLRLLGLDPGLRRTGWGAIDVAGGKLCFVASGVVSADVGLPMSDRLAEILRGLQKLMDDIRPDEAAVEKTFVNANPASALKLGQARAAALMAPALAGVSVAEYAPNVVKKSVVGAGHAGKAQIQAMVSVLLPGARAETADAADALAVAICHAHWRGARDLEAASCSGR